MVRGRSIFGLGAMAGAIALLTLAPQGHAQQGQLATRTEPLLRGAVAAVVDDEAITTYQLRQRMAWIALSTGAQITTQEQQVELQREALTALIDERLQSQELKRQETQRKLKPGALFADEKDIDDAIADYARQNNLTAKQFLDVVEGRGVAAKSLREQIRISVSWQRWTFGYYRSRVRISEEKVEAMMRDITAAASKPSYLVSEIFIDSARAGSVDAAAAAGTQLLGLLQQNARFENLARQYSALPSAANGGEVGWLTTAELEPAVVQALDNLRPGQVTQPIRTTDGVYLVLLREKRAGGVGSSMVNLRQAAISLPADATPQQVQAAQAQLASVKAKATGGCASLQAAAQGARGVEVGDLGEADAKDLAAPFRDAVEKLQPNQVSDPVRTAVGLHLIALCSRTATGAGVPSREDIENNLFSREMAMIQRRELRNLRNAATISQPR